MLKIPSFPTPCTTISFAEKNVAKNLQIIRENTIGYVTKSFDEFFFRNYDTSVNKFPFLSVHTVFNLYLLCKQTFRVCKLDNDK